MTRDTALNVYLRRISRSMPWGDIMNAKDQAIEMASDTSVEEVVVEPRPVSESDVIDLRDSPTIVENSEDQKKPDLSADSPALQIFANYHPAGYAAIGALIAALIGTFAFDTERTVGSLGILEWIGLVVIIVLSGMPPALNAVRAGIELIGSTAGKLVWWMAWLVFFAQLVNVITRYLNPLFEVDILIGQVTSVAWQTFALIAIIGLPYGVKEAVNPRIDFWWAEWTDRSKAWLDFVMHTFFFLPFLYTTNFLLRQSAATALGQRFGDKSWPSGWRVWETWEQSSDADQLPVGPIKAMIFVGFVMFALQIAAEIIKTGFVLMGKRDYGQVASGDEFQRIE